MKKFSVLTLIIFISCGAESTTSTVAETTTTVLDTTTSTVSDTTTTVLDTTTTVLDTTTSTVADTTTTTTVAKALSPFLDDEIIRVFPASDLQQETVDLTIQYTNEAYALWMGDDYYGKSQAKAIYIMITGSDMEAGKNANREYCNHLTATGFPSADWCRLDTYKDYVNNGGGGINSSAVDGFYFMVMAPQDNEIGNWYKTMT